MSKFPYYLPSEGAYKPWIPVRLGCQKTHKVTPAPIVALIDSGADVCFCATNIGLWLGAGLKGKNCEVKEFKTANRGSFSAVKGGLTLYVPGKYYQCPFYFADSLPPETPIILGQLGFFDHFKITFDLKNKEIEVI